jgi:hypothetical protein
MDGADCAGEAVGVSDGEADIASVATPRLSTMSCPRAGPALRRD